MRPPSESLLDTIAALATPLGRSAIAVIRISGDRTRAILSAVAPELSDPIEPRRPHLVPLIRADGEVLDRGLVTLFAAPASFTGEDLAEISVHGSPVVVERLLRTLVAAGARPARPGEFTERAYRLGKLDLVEAEAIRDLIDSRTEGAARAGAKRLGGALSSRLAAVREDLLAASAGLTATIDFAEDVGETVSPAVAAHLRSARDALARLAASYETGRLLSAGCRVVILGRPNAGKSTLFNALVGSARAIVTEVPGTTRDTLEATIDVCGVPVDLVDTAGLRETDDRVERIGVERAREEGERAAAILYVYDASEGWSDVGPRGGGGVRRPAGRDRRQQDRPPGRIGADRSHPPTRRAWRSAASPRRPERPCDHSWSGRSPPESRATRPRKCSRRCGNATSWNARGPRRMKPFSRSTGASRRNTPPPTSIPLWQRSPTFSARRRPRTCSSGYFRPSASASDRMS